MHRYINTRGALDYTGQMVQQQVVAKNPNVFAVLNGHYHGAAINITAFDDDGDGTKERNVYQICTDYQSGEQGGMGYLKMLYFDIANQKVYMNSYSPILDDINYYDSPKLPSYSDGVIAMEQDIYELDVDFGISEKTLTTTSFEAAVYKTELIGSTQTNNSEASILYSGLAKGDSYAWYATVTNPYGLVTRTDVQEFTYTGEFINSEVPGTNNPEITDNITTIKNISSGAGLNTGDNTMIIPLLIISTLSATCIVLFIRRKKKKIC